MRLTKNKIKLNLNSNIRGKINIYSKILHVNKRLT